jgi:hypothetical protein
MEWVFIITWIIGSVAFVALMLTFIFLKCNPKWSDIWLRVFLLSVLFLVILWSVFGMLYKFGIIRI